MEEVWSVDCKRKSMPTRFLSLHCGTGLHWYEVKFLTDINSFLLISFNVSPCESKVCFTEFYVIHSRCKDVQKI